MNCRTYELYNENEYFLKFLSIHPTLFYSNELVDKKKLQYQQYLLTLYNNKNITIDKLKKKYNDILTIEIELKNKLNKIKQLNKKIENEIENIHNTQLIELLTNNINFN